MVYENIKLTKSNMAVVDGYFFCFDDSTDMLLQKVDDGDTAFEYPLDIDLSRYTISDSFETIDSDRWDTQGSPTLVDDGVRFSVNNSTEGLYGKRYTQSITNESWIVRGNFDIRVYFSNLNIISGNADFVAPRLTLKRLADNPEPNYGLRISRMFDNFHKYFMERNEGSWNGVGENSVYSSDRVFYEGGLRFYRSGNTTYGYYLNNDNSWHYQTNNNSAIIANDVRLRVYARSYYNNPDLSVDVTNVTVQSLLTSVRSTQYDGKYFWTLQGVSNTDKDVVVRKWYLKNGVCRLDVEYLYRDAADIYYDCDAFALEHYITAFSEDRSAGAYNLKMDEYYDSVNVTYSGVVLRLGPNISDQYEEVTVSGVISDTVYLTTPLQYSYSASGTITLANSFFMFNNYYGTSTSSGSLMRFSTYDGSLLSMDSDVEYQNVSAAVFNRFRHVLFDYPDAHALVYVKGSQAKLRNMSDLIETVSAETLYEDFTGTDYTYPNSSDWSRIGTPYIYNNKLLCAININGTDEITSKYLLSGDIDVQVSGSMGGYTSFSGAANYANHYMGLNIPQNNCEIGYRITSSGTDPLVYIGLNGVIQSEQFITTSGSDPNYIFDIIRVDDQLDFYYKISVNGEFPQSGTLLHNMTLSDLDCSVSLGLKCVGTTISGAYFDDLTYGHGILAYYPAEDVPFYGIMQMDNVRKNQSTIIDVYDLSVDGDSLYRLQDEGTYYGTDNSWSTYNYQVSPIRSFIDGITVNAYPAILPANGRNVSQVTAIVVDQYANGVLDKEVTFTDDDPIGFITINPVNTEVFFGTGEAVTNYKAGTAIRTVTVQGEATQYD